MAQPTAGEDDAKAAGPERLLVYRLAVELYERVLPLAAEVRRRRRFELADQIDRCACSGVLNLAEGSSEIRPREKARIYRIARRSHTELRAALSLAVPHNFIASTELLALQRRAQQLVILESRLIRAMELRGGK